MRARTLLAVLLLLPTWLAAEVQFGGLDLADNRLLFQATVDLPDFGSYSTLFGADVARRELLQLTFFPEKVQLVDGELQIQNRFGVFRTHDGLKDPAPVTMFPSFASGDQVETGRLLPVESSPDGRFLVFLRPTSIAYGDLVLYDTTNGAESILARDTELSLEQPLTQWSPDSAWFVYASAGSLYYYSIEQYRAGRVVDSSYRRVTKGRIENARWASAGVLYYVSGDLVYRIQSGEFFTKSLYSGIISIGEIAGKIPFVFDPNFDSFWISPDGQKLLLDKGGRNLFLYFLQTDDYAGGKTSSLPYLYLPRNARIRRVAWSASDVVTVLAESAVKGKRVASLFRVRIPSSHEVSSFEPTADQGVRDAAFLPEGDRVALLHDGGVTVKSYDSWTTIREIATDDPLAALWLDASDLVIAGRWTIARHNLDSGVQSLVTLSQAATYGYSEDLKEVVATAGGRTYSVALTEAAQSGSAGAPAPAAGEAAGQGLSPAGRGATGATAAARAPAPSLQSGEWKPAAAVATRKAQIASDDYRVYLEPRTRGSYRNIVMVRGVRDFGTLPLFPPERIAYEPFPPQEPQELRAQRADLTIFNHGSRSRRRQVALVFDAVDSIEGLPTILDTLKQYGARATFFVGGEAIRRYPGAVKEIADSGNEVGSLFFANFDLTDTRYRVDKEFIKLGLARTEDLYFATTGRELTLLWHAPYYVTDTDVVEASKEMNYTYVGRDIDSLDWVTRDDPIPTRGLYMPASRLVERIIDKKEPGSIIPILVGKPDGYREDYLFQKLDLLINALLARGYEVVPVSVLMDNSR